jgi:hypothetical protein
MLNGFNAYDAWRLLRRIWRLRKTDGEGEWQLADVRPDGTDAGRRSAEAPNPRGPDGGPGSLEP